MQAICATCGAELKRLWTGWSCPNGPHGKDEVAEHRNARGPLTAMYRIPRAAVVDFAGHAFIAEEALETWDDYYDHTVGDVISVAGTSGRTMFFELAGRVRAEDGRKGYLCIRVDPDTEFKDLPTLDVNPEEATLLDGKEADQGGDEARET